MQPPVAGPKRDVGVRAERAVVVVAERVDRRLRGTGAPRGKDYGHRTLLRNVYRLRKVGGALGHLSEQGFGPRHAKASACRLQEFLVFGYQGRAGRPPEQPRHASWWEAVAEGTGYVSGTDQGKHQSHVTLVFGQMERHPASRDRKSTRLNSSH